jgi:hypothetical protein
MCAVTVKRLIASGELEERPNSLGGMSLILSPRGARRLSNFEIEADDGRSLSSVDGPQFYHRTLGNRYLIEKLRDGATAFSEYAFIKNRAPVTRAQMSERFNKFPDGLLVYPGAPRGLASHLYAADWVEVESSFKSTDDIEKMIRIATRAGSYLNAQENIILERVVFVFDIRQRHEKTLTSYLKREVLSKFPDEAPQLLNSIVFARVCIRTPLVWESYTEVTAAELLLTEHQTNS